MILFSGGFLGGNCMFTFTCFCKSSTERTEWVAQFNAWMSQCWNAIRAGGDLKCKDTISRGSERREVIVNINTNGGDLSRTNFHDWCKTVASNPTYLLSHGMLATFHSYIRVFA
jgi:hypothetical protein